MKKTGFFSKFYVICCFIFFYFPILITVIFSFNSSKSLSHFTGFSLRWYKALISNTDIMNAVYVSITIAVLATILSTFLGTITAIGLSRSKKILRDTILTMNDIPILNPDIVTAIGWMLLFSSLGFEKGYVTMLLAHIGFCTPFVLTTVYPKVRQLDPNLAEAAMDLGATPYEALRKVILPILKPGIFAGALLAFTMSFDDFVISYFVSGNGVKNISIIAYNMSKRINPTINALSALVVAVIAVILAFMALVPRLSARRAVKNGGRTGRPMKYFRRVMSAVGVCLIGAVFFLYFSGRNRSDSKAVLRVYNAGEYVDPDLITEFEEEYNCEIVYETFESNEMMYTKLQAGDQYDILVPSDYMVERLIREDYLQPINWDLLPDADNLDPAVMGQVTDPDNTYTVPYFWGTVGILYDKNAVSSEDLQQGWNLLMDQDYAGSLYMYDSERDSFMVALKALGYSMNTTDDEEINAAYDWLVRQRDTMDPIYAGDDIIDNMIAGNKDLAVVYSGDAAYIMLENSSLAYFEPDEGTNEWCDYMVITKDCQNVELAHEFINFFLQEDIALRNTQYVGYTSPLKAVREQAAAEDFAGIDAYNPRTGYNKDEVFRYQEQDVRTKFARLWTMVKSK